MGGDLEHLLNSIAESLKYGQKSSCPGTKGLDLRYFQEKDSFETHMMNVYINCCMMEKLKAWSQEELRLVDYESRTQVSQMPL